MEKFFRAGADERETFHICAGEYRGARELTALCRYAEAKIAREHEEQGYRVYLTDALYALVNRGMTLQRRYADMCASHSTEIEEDPEEIIARIRAKLEGLK